MKPILFFTLFFSITVYSFPQPVFKNPGIPDNESFTIHEYLDTNTGYITSRVNVSLVQQDNKKYYLIRVNEGDLFINEIKVNYSDLTTISEKRFDVKTKKAIQYFIRTNDSVRFYNKEKDVYKYIRTDETNIYSPLAYYFSFRGFPFGIGNSVSFKTYMYAYGGVLTMKLKNVAIKKVTVKTDTYDCYVLELSVGGWQSVFAPDKYYFYFSVKPPHIFVQYEEKVDGKWRADEITSYSQ